MCWYNDAIYIYAVWSFDGGEWWLAFGEQVIAKNKDKYGANISMLFKLFASY